MLRRTLIGAAIAAPLGACGSPTIADYCYKYSAIVRVGGRDYEGVSINRVRWREQGWNPAGHQFSVKIWAEAPVIDLGDHGLLFALLRRPRTQQTMATHMLPNLAVRLAPRPSDERAAALRELMSIKQAFLLPVDEWPLFVWFRDLADPSSVEEVTPASFARKYGAGAGIKQLTMQVADERPTQRILRVLPWLRWHGDSLNLNGTRGMYASRYPLTSLGQSPSASGVSPFRRRSETSAAPEAVAPTRICASGRSGLGAYPVI